MEKTRLISRIFYYILIAFVLIGAIWYGKTGNSFASSKYLFFGTIGSGIISAVFHVIYFIQIKKYKELKQFFIWLVILIAAIYLIGSLV